MCVILYKPRNVELPEKEIISQCWKKHSDGAGVYTKGHIDKGFMKEGELIDFLTETVTKENLAVVHFRTGTSGEKTAPFTHPFPLSKKMKQLKKLNYDIEKPILFHNGVLRINVEQDLSDTMTLARTMGSMNLNQKQIAQMVGLVFGGDKGLIIFPDEKLLWFGEWHKEKGCYYSNKSYEVSSVTVYSYSSYNCGRNWMRDANGGSWIWSKDVDDDDKTDKKEISGKEEENNDDEIIAGKSKDELDDLMKSACNLVDQLIEDDRLCPYLDDTHSPFCAIMDVPINEEQCQLCSYHKESIREAIDDLCMICTESMCESCKYIGKMCEVESAIEEIEANRIEYEEKKEKESEIEDVCNAQLKNKSNMGFSAQ